MRKAIVFVAVVALAVAGLAAMVHAQVSSTPGFLEEEFTLRPGTCSPFTFPEVKTSDPVQIQVGFDLRNGGTQTPSALMSALVNYIPSAHQFTWIGTNSDGTQLGSNSLESTPPIIAKIYGGHGSSPPVNAFLKVGSTTAGTLSVCQNSASTTLDGHYDVLLWFSGQD